MPDWWPNLSIVPEGFGSRLARSVGRRLADALTFRDIEFESEAFNRRFTVKGPDERFATAFCDARMMDWLLRHGEGYAFKVVGDRLLCWT
ncbi:MAG: hypothetical protein M3138_02450 [Actinomycetota bacterium]|nr:hypothetical protein [Actinomycetota bacterium]